MATYFTIDSGNFSAPATFGTAFTSGSANTIPGTGFIVPTTYSFAANVNSTGLSNIGIALQLSARSTTPTGTITVILSGAEAGAVREVSVPVSSLTPLDGSNNILQITPMGWQYFAFDTALTVGTGKAMKVGVKTSDANQVSLLGSTLANLNRYIVNTTTTVPALAVDAVHITGKLTNGGGVVNTVNYDLPSTTIGTLYIHDRGILSFDPNINTSITIAGTNGVQVTPNGTINAGTPISPINANCTINLTNTYINVHNGGIFNTCGVQRSSYAYLLDDLPAGPNFLFNTTQSNWQDNDNVIFTPNTTLLSSFETRTISTAIFDGRLTTDDTIYNHTASTYIPGILNITRNIKIIGTSTGSFIRFLDGSVNDLRYTEFSGFNNTQYKGLAFGTNTAGAVNLLGCVFKGSNTTSMPAFSFVSSTFSTKSVTSNVSIKECNFYGFGGTTTDAITINAVSANNFTFTDNVILSATQNGMLINGLSSTYTNIKDNYIFCARQNGLYVTNPYVLSGAIGGVGCMNSMCGSVVAGTNVRSNFNGLGGHYNALQGVNISGTMNTLSTIVFSNLAANGNRSTGVMLSGNANNLFTPIKVNINGLIANENKYAGFEGYAITGNLSSMTLDNNESGNILISIGNNETIFDGIDSANTNTYFTKLFDNITSVGVSSDNPYGVLDASYFSSASTAEDYLSTLNSNLTFSEDFTIECWIKTGTSNLDTVARRIFSIGANSPSGLQLILGTANTTAASTLSVFTNAVLIGGSVNVATNSWVHVAISRVNGIMRLFVDGVQDGDEISNTTNFNAGATSPLHIFKYAGAVQGRFAGFISNFRISNSKGFYSESFTPSLTPFIIESNTSLLLNGDGYTNRSYKHLNQFSNIEVLSGRNYSRTLIKNSYLQGDLVNSIKLHNTKFEQFTIESSSLISNVADVGTASDTNYIEGSYRFNKCFFGTGILSSTLADYQPEVFTETGFSIMKENNNPNKHYRLLGAGKISLDTALVKIPNTISEKLEPTSLITKLRCGSKMVPVNKGKSYIIGCYIYKSAGYSGSAPRLMLKHNSALGYKDTVLATSVEADERWELLSGFIPAALDQGIFEVYVDCSGERGSGSVNIDSWTLV